MLLLQDLLQQKTGMLVQNQASEDQGLYQRLMSHIPLGRPGTPEEMAHGFLADPDSNITGHVLTVDGAGLQALRGLKVYETTIEIFFCTNSTRRLSWINGNPKSLQTNAVVKEFELAAQVASAQAKLLVSSTCT